MVKAQDNAQYCNEHEEQAGPDIEDAFGDHDIEYWILKDNRLVPATAEEVARIRASEQEYALQARLWRLKLEKRGRSTARHSLLAFRLHRGDE